MEYFITGYCRNYDQSRMVEVETENGELTQADCDYGTCPYEGNCEIAKRIRAVAKGGEI